MRKRRLVALVAAPLAVAMLASACGGGGVDTEPGVITVNNTEPQNPLIPSNTTENGGHNPVDAMFTGLMEFNPENGAAYEANAQSIDTTDNKTFTIRLKPGWTFHDGTPVTAQSYVRAWNWAAYAPNGQSTASFFDYIQGYDQLQSDDPDGDGPQQASPPAANEMSGLKVLDENTFEVTLSAPFTTFPQTLGYIAFSPLPDSFYADPDAFARHPVGDGPFRFAGRQPNVQISLRAYDQYKGADKPTIRGVDFVVYDRLEGAYEAVKSGELDYLDQVPPSALADGLWKAEMRDSAVDAPGFLQMILAFPTYRPEYSDPNLRRAVSMSIDRPAISEKIFNDAKKPATGWVPATMPDYRSDSCGRACEFHPREAKELFDKTGFQGPIVINSNADGGHKEWIDAVCGNVKQNLGVDCAFSPTPTFGEFNTKSQGFQQSGPFRLTWQADYPSPESFLAKVYGTDGSSNYSKYSNPEFDAALERASSAPNIPEANKRYREAEQVVARDMPVIPLFDVGSQSVHSDRVSNVRTTPYRALDLAGVRLNP